MTTRLVWGGVAFVSRPHGGHVRLQADQPVRPTRSTARPSRLHVGVLPDSAAILHTDAPAPTSAAEPQRAAKSAGSPESADRSGPLVAAHQPEAAGSPEVEPQSPWSALSCAASLFVQVQCFRTCTMTCSSSCWPSSFRATWSASLTSPPRARRPGRRREIGSVLFGRGALSRCPLHAPCPLFFGWRAAWGGSWTRLWTIFGWTTARSASSVSARRAANG